MTFSLREDTELYGIRMKVHMFVEADGHDDMDLFINVQKADADGNWIPWFTLDEPTSSAINAAFHAVNLTRSFQQTSTRY